jgi:hypothetical protein
LLRRVEFIIKICIKYVDYINHAAFFQELPRKEILFVHLGQHFFLLNSLKEFFLLHLFQYLCLNDWGHIFDHQDFEHKRRICNTLDRDAI